MCDSKEVTNKSYGCKHINLEILTKLQNKPRMILHLNSCRIFFKLFFHFKDTRQKYVYNTLRCEKLKLGNIEFDLKEWLF